METRIEMIENSENDQKLIDTLYKLVLLMLPGIVAHELNYPDAEEDSLAKVSESSVAMIDWYRRNNEALGEDKGEDLLDSPVLKNLEKQVGGFVAEILPLFLSDSYLKEKAEILDYLARFEAHALKFKRCKAGAKRLREIKPKHPDLRHIEILAAQEMINMGVNRDKLAALFFMRDSLLNDLEPLSTKDEAHERIGKKVALQAALEILQKGKEVITPGRRIRKKEAQAIPGLQLCDRSFWIEKDKILVIDRGSKFQELPYGGYAKGKKALVYHSDGIHFTLAHAFMKTSRIAADNRPKILAHHEHKLLEKLGLSFGGGERDEKSGEKIHSSYDEFQVKRNGVDLVTYVNQIRDAWDSQDLVAVLKGCAEELWLLHKQGLLHRDIKPDNYMYDSKAKRIAVVDLGLAVDLNDPNDKIYLRGYVGTSSYVAPEIRHFPQYNLMDPAAVVPYSTASDCYSLGITFAIITEILVEVKYENTQRLIYNKNALSSPFLQNLGELSRQHLNTLVLSMINRNPMQRPTLPQVLEELEELELLELELDQASEFAANPPEFKAKTLSA